MTEVELLQKEESYAVDHKGKSYTVIERFMEVNRFTEYEFYPVDGEDAPRCAHSREVSDEVKRELIGAVEKFKTRAMCPKCGYEPAPDEVLTVWDRNDCQTKVSVRNGKLDNPTWELGENWENKEKIICPSCGKESPKSDWGLKWNWEA